MGAFIKGDVVITPFPFSDLSNAKRRPAVVVAYLTGEDVILCQVTSQARMDGYAVTLSTSDFASGGLQIDSIARPNRLFTADGKILVRTAGTLTQAKMKEITDKIVEIIT